MIRFRGIRAVLRPLPPAAHMNAVDNPSGIEKRCPDITCCRASLLGTAHLVFCQSDNRIACDYALPFGIKYFCIHPQSMEIAGHTSRGLSATSGSGAPD
jgi:hypothetical protein